MDLYVYADVSTGYITAEDNRLLHDLGDERLPMSVGEYEHGYFIAVPSADYITEVNVKLRELGFSQSFCTLLAAVAKAGAFVLRLDSDGGEVADLPTYDW